MNSSKVKKAIESKIIYMVKVIMEKENCTEAVAFKHFKTSKLYEILTDEKSGLYLEPIEFLCEAYQLEIKQSPQEMIKYINSGL